MERLPWDSEFFGTEIGRVRVTSGDELDAVTGRARLGGLRCVYLFVPAKAVDAVTHAVKLGARLVDVRTEMAAELAAVSRGTADAPVRLAGDQDRDRLTALAKDVSAASRFRADPRFPPERVVEMYRICLRRCLDEGWVAVAEDATRGLVGSSDKAGEARVHHLYVSPQERGRGLGRGLMLEALRHTAEPRASCATQAGNVGAVRLFESLGFRTRSVDAILHLWLDELRDPEAPA